MKAKISSPKVLISGLTWRSLIVADVKIARGSTVRYVLLTDEDRSALRRKLNVEPNQWLHDGSPRFLVSHAIDERGAVDETRFSAKGIWTNSESLWVRVDLADLALRALNEWRADKVTTNGCIWAPCWQSLTAVRLLALAAGHDDPIREEDRP